MIIKTNHKERTMAISEEEKNAIEFRRNSILEELAKMEKFSQIRISGADSLPQSTVGRFIEKNPDHQFRVSHTNHDTYVTRIENRSDDPLQVHKVTTDEMYDWYDSVKDKKKKKEWDEVYSGYSMRRMFGDLVYHGDINLVEVLDKLRNKKTKAKKVAKKSNTKK